MPLPKPTKDEKKQDFISRCMRDLANEYTDEKQRAAICYTQFQGEDSELTKEPIITKSKWGTNPEITTPIDIVKQGE